MVIARALIITAIAAVLQASTIASKEIDQLTAIGLVVLLTIVTVLCVNQLAYGAGFNKGVQHAEHVYRHD